MKNYIRKRKMRKILRILREDEIESILYMIHNHETGRHFGVEAIYNKIAERYY